MSTSPLSCGTRLSEFKKQRHGPKYVPIPALRRSRDRASSPFEMLHDLGQRHRVQNPLCRYASLASHFDPPVHVIELGNRVGVGVDAEHASEVERALVPAPVQIQPPRVSVDLNSDSVLGAGTEHRLNVNVAA